MKDRQRVGSCIGLLEPILPQQGVGWFFVRNSARKFRRHKTQHHVIPGLDCCHSCDQPVAVQRSLRNALVNARAHRQAKHLMLPNCFKRRWMLQSSIQAAAAASRDPRWTPFGFNFTFIGIANSGHRPTEIRCELQTREGADTFQGPSDRYLCCALYGVRTAKLDAETRNTAECRLLACHSCIASFIFVVCVRLIHGAVALRGRSLVRRCVG